MNEYQSYTSDNRKSKQTINTLEEMSKNQSFRVLKLQTSGFGKLNNSSKRNPQIFDLSQVSTSMPLSQKNMLSFLAFEEAKRPNNYEQLYQDLQLSKQQVNGLKDENLRLRTKIQHNEKEFLKYENLIEDLTMQKKSSNCDLQIITLRRQLKEKSQELDEKNKELDNLKKNSKVCKLQELEIEKKVYFEQTLKMKHMLQLSQDQISYQNSRIEQIQQLESQLDSCHEQIYQLQTKQTEFDDKINHKELLNKQLRQQIKTQQQKSQFLKDKYSILQQKYENLQSLYSALKGNGSCLSTQSSYKFPKDVITMKLHQRRVTMAQYHLVLQKMRQVKSKQEFSSILQSEPFSLNSQESQFVIDKLTTTVHSMHQQFQSLLNYQSLEELDEQQAQEQIIKTLNLNKEKIQQYWNQFKGTMVGKEDIFKFIQILKFEWDELVSQYFVVEILSNSNEITLNTLIQKLENQFESIKIIESQEKEIPQDSFIRDLKNQQEEQKIIENFNSEEEFIDNKFFPAEMDDMQFDLNVANQAQGKLTSKYGQQNEIQEVNEEDMMSSKPQDDDNANDLAYIESNQQEDLQEIKSLEILQDQ